MVDQDEKKPPRSLEYPAEVIDVDAIIDVTIMDEEFYYADGNFRLMINTESALGGNATYSDTRTFLIHKYKIEEFLEIKARIKTSSTDLDFIQLQGDPVDFHNTFRVLYSPSYTPIEHETPVLISTLKVATEFKHSGLREFAIRQLELKSLAPTEIIPIAQKLDIPDWEARAIERLINRNESIALEEAEVIGLSTFVRVASQREKRLARRRTMNPMTVLIPAPASSQRVAEEAPERTEAAEKPRRGRPPSQRTTQSSRRRIVLGGAPARVAQTKTATMGGILLERGSD